MLKSDRQTSRKWKRKMRNRESRETQNQKAVQKTETFRDGKGDQRETF